MRTILLGLVAVAGCGGGDSADVRPVGVAIGAATSIAHAAQLSLSAMSGSTVCATVTSACAAYPCASGAVTVALGGSCPLPLGGAGSGSVNVTGSFQSADDASLGETFVSAMAGARTVVVAKTRNLTVKRSGKSVSVSYLGQDVDTQSAGTLAAQSSWMVSIDTGGTPDPSDDTYTVSGVSQNGGGTSGGQLSVQSAVLSPGCALNPISGTATIQNAGLTSITQDTVTFHAACDGKADLKTTTGGMTTVTLDFFK